MSIRNLDKIFQPQRVAVIGASDTTTSVGYTVLRNLVGSGFEGVVYPVNPKRDSVQGIHAYQDIPSLPHVPDLAVVCTPSHTIPKIVQQCGEAGTRDSGALTVAGGAFSLGIILFSGSLYVMGVTGAPPIAGAAPLGGSLFMAGWAALIWAAVKGR